MNEKIQIIRNIIHFTFLISASDAFLLTFNTSYNLLSAIFHFDLKEEKKSRGDSNFLRLILRFFFQRMLCCQISEINVTLFFYYRRIFAEETF